MYNICNRVIHPTTKDRGHSCSKLPVKDSSSLADVGTDNYQKRLINRTVLINSEKEKGTGQLNFNVKDNKYVKIGFYIQSHISDSSYYGYYYVYVNKQFQFSKFIGIKLDVIVTIDTNVEPGNDSYPLDPGRENIRPPYDSSIKDFVSYVSKIFQEVAEDTLLKDGMFMRTINEDVPPMEIKPVQIEGEEKSPESLESSENLARVLENAFMSPIGLTNAPASPQSQPGTSQPEIETEVEKSNEEKVQQISQAVEQHSGISLNEQQRAIMHAALTAIVEEANENREKRFSWSEKAVELLEQLQTPCVLSVQKNFVSHELAEKNVPLVADLMIAWQKTLKSVSQAIAESRYWQYTEGKSFVPGIVYSSECLALYMPPSGKQRNHMIMVNPVTVAALTLPELFQKAIVEGNIVSGSDDATSAEGSGGTPINRVADFLFHEAVHELTHFMFIGGERDFHIYISKIEMLCHHKYPEIRNIVKDHMPEMKKKMRRLINMIKKGRAAESKLANAAIDINRNWYKKAETIEKNLR